MQERFAWEIGGAKLHIIEQSYKKEEPVATPRFADRDWIIRA